MLGRSRRKALAIVAGSFVLLVASGCGGLPAEEPAAESPAGPSETATEPGGAAGASAEAPSAGATAGAAALSCDAQPVPGAVPTFVAPAIEALPAKAGTLLELVNDLRSRFPTLAGGEAALAGAVVKLRVPVPSLASPAWVRADWEANLLSAVLIDQLYANQRSASTTVDLCEFGQSETALVDLELVDPEGRTQLAGPGLGAVAREQKFADPPEAELEQTILAGARSLGLGEVTLSFLHPLQIAPVISIRSDDPLATAKTLEDFKAQTLLVGRDPRQLEGFYLELLDGAGQAVEVRFSMSRAGGGGTWYRPDIREALGLPPGGAPPS